MSLMYFYKPSNQLYQAKQKNKACAVNMQPELQTKYEDWTL